MVSCILPRDCQIDLSELTDKKYLKNIFDEEILNWPYYIWLPPVYFDSFFI